MFFVSSIPGWTSWNNNNKVTEQIGESGLCYRMGAFLSWLEAPPLSYNKTKFTLSVEKEDFLCARQSAMSLTHFLLCIYIYWYQLLLRRTKRQRERGESAHPLQMLQMALKPELEIQSSSPPGEDHSCHLQCALTASWNQESNPGTPIWGMLSNAVCLIQ